MTYNMIIELIGVDILLGAHAAYNGRPIGGRLYGISIGNLMLALWILDETSAPRLG